MRWQEDKDKAEKLSFKEIEDKISEHNNVISESALNSMNKIHCILSLDKSIKEKIDNIQEIEKEHQDLVVNGVANYIDKSEKEKQTDYSEIYRKKIEDAYIVYPKFTDELNKGDEDDN